MPWILYGLAELSVRSVCNKMSRMRYSTVIIKHMLSISYSSKIHNGVRRLYWMTNGLLFIIIVLVK